MIIWLIQTGEQIPETDGDVKIWRTYQLAINLTESGHEVIYIGSTYNQVEKKFRSNTNKYLKSKYGFRIILLHSNIIYRNNISFNRLIYQSNIAKKLKYYSHILDKPNLIICSLPTLELCHISSTYLKLKYRCKLVIDVRDVWPDVYLNVFKKFKFIGKSILYFEFKKNLINLNSADGIVAVSDSYLTWAKEKIKNKSTTKFSVFPLGSTDLNNFNCSGRITDRALNGSDIIITYYGTFGKSYDLETLCEAANYFSHNNSIKFVIIGDGLKYNIIKKLTSNNANVILTGWVNRDVAVSWLKKSDIGIAPYVKDAKQSLPNKIFEYMSTSNAILSSLQGEMNLIISQNNIGLSYEAENKESLISAINNITNSKTNLKNMQNNSRKLFDMNYNQNNIYKDYASWVEKF